MNVCFLDAERRGSGKHEAESHDRLIQRIEIDVVRIPIPFALPSCLLRAKHQDFSALSKSSTAPWTTSRSLCRGCRRQRRPFPSSTIATRVRRTRRKDQQVCLPFFLCGGLKGLKRCSDVSRALSVFLCLLTWDAPSSGACVVLQAVRGSFKEHNAQRTLWWNIITSYMIYSS